MTNSRFPIPQMFSPTELLWALIGLLLTIGGTFLKASTTAPPWQWSEIEIPVYSLGVTYQIGAVLLVGCVGGKNAGALAQIAYLVLGLIGFQVFDQGGGIGYIKRLTFGYLLGFVPGAWLCGFFAFRTPPKLETLAFSSLCGLLTVHFVGLSYLVIGYSLNLGFTSDFPLLPSVLNYSFYPLPGHLAIVCAVTVLAFFVRRLLFY